MPRANSAQLIGDLNGINPVWAVVWLCVHGKPVSAASGHIFMTVAGIVDQQVRFLREHALVIVERVQDVGPRSIVEDLGLESKVVVKQLRHGIGVTHGCLQLVELFIVVVPDHQGIVRTNRRS